MRSKMDIDIEDKEEEEGKEKKKGKEDIGAEMEIIRRKLDNMKDNDPKLPKLVRKQRELRRRLRKKELMRELKSIDDNEDFPGFFGL